MAVSRGPEGTVEPFGKDAPICDSDSAVALVTKHKLGISDLLNLFFWGGVVNCADMSNIDIAALFLMPGSE